MAAPATALVSALTSRRPSLRPRYRPMPVAELDTHLAVVDLLEKCRDPRWEYSHFPAGEKRDMRTGAILKAMGLKPGWPDFIFVGPLGDLRFLEVKSTYGELSEAQQAFFARMRSRGIECRVARSIDEAIRILTGWGVVRPISTRGEAA
jgi:hypothetical protein